jgi:hypothetical protein
MNTEQAKKLDFPKLLSKLGFEPIKTVKNGTELWYNSPFRNEKIPSFHTSFLKGKWIWNDFGDTGGTVIDFVMRYQNLDVTGALSFLDGSFQKTIPSLKLDEVATSFQQPESLFRLDRVQSIKLSRDYLENQRGISVSLANKYLVEAVYTNTQTGKQYFGVAIKNVSDGYEVRNPYFKTSIGKKDFSFLKGKKSNAVCLFEGFMDFPSAIINLYMPTADETARDILLSPNKTALLPDIIILNSASFKESVLAFIKKQDYKFIHGFWDNDKTGLELKTYFEEHLGFYRVISWNHLYQPYKDFNEALVAKFK